MPWRACLAWFWTFVILALCWFPRSYMVVDEGIRQPFLFPHFDKVIHLGIFVVFSVLWMRAVVSSRRRLWIAIAGVALAVISEVGQEMSFVNRDATWLDGLADIVGVIIGLAAFEAIGRFWTAPAVQAQA